MAFDLKGNWPIVAGGGLLLFGVIAMRSGGGSVQNGYSVATPDNSGQISLGKATLAAEQGQLQLIGGGLQSYLNYLNTNHAIDAASYATYEQTLAQEYSYTEQTMQQQLQSSEALAMANTMKKPSWELWLENVTNWVDAYFGAGAPGLNKQPQQQQTQPQVTFA